MERGSATDKIREKYIESYLENSQRINYTDLTPEKDGLITVLYKDLPHTVIDGYPIASDFVGPDGKTYSMNEVENLSPEDRAKCELRYYYLPNTHELYVGTTGSGKTTGCVEPQLRAISSQKNKPNLFVTDPKGELFDRNGQHLKDNGYDTFVINFKDLLRSDKWNPLLEIYDLQMSLNDVGSNVVMHTGKVKRNLELFAKRSEYSTDGYLEYKGIAFPNGESLEQYLTFERDYITTCVSDLVNQFAHMMITPKSKNDMTWEQGAQELLKGLVYCLLEDALETPDRLVLTRDRMNLASLHKFYLAVKTPILANTMSLGNHPLTENKSATTRGLMATCLANAEKTMRSYCGVFDTSMLDWFCGHIFALTVSNTVNLENSEKKPFAIFLITRDYEKSDFQVAGLFIDWVYRQMLERAEKGTSTRTLHFLLDEFGNIPEIKDFENKISTSRSRNIWFHLSVQSYMQIEAVYGSTRSVIIRDNCNSQIFLGAQNRQTKEIFSAECGRHNVPSLESKLNPTINTINEVPLIPVSSLDLIKPGEIFIKRLYKPVITAQYIRSYVCAEQGSYTNFGGGLKHCTPISAESFKSEKYIYPDLDKYIKVDRRNPDYDW